LSFWLAAAVVALAVLAYANATRNGFVLDDDAIVVKNPLVRSVGNLVRIFTTDYWTGAGAAGDAVDPGLYRPLTVFSYAQTYRVSGLSATAFHITNLALHAGIALVLFLFASELLGSAAPAFAAAAVFAVHPIHVEAVTGIVGRAEILVTLFVVLALWLGRRPSVIAAIGAGLLYLLALFSKESAVTLPVLFALYDWTRREQLRERGILSVKALAPRYAALAAALVVYLAFRLHAVTQSAHVWSGWIGVPAYARVLTAIRTLFEYLWLFVWPRTLLADYWVTDVPIARSLADGPALVSLILLVGLIVLVATKLRHQRTLVFSIAWFLVTILPASNLFFASGLGKAERILYLPSVGLCLVLGCAVLALDAWPQTRRATLTVALPAALLALSARTIRRNEDWRDTFTLASASLAVSPHSFLMNNLVARELVARGAAGQAVPLLEEALRQSPNKAQAHTLLGVAYYADKQTERAVAEYNKALQLDPRNAEALNDLGVVFLDQGNVNEAAKWFNAAISTAPRYADAHTNRGLVYLSAGRLDEAIQDFRAAIATDSTRAEAHNSLGVAYARSGRTTEAAAEFREALRLRPDYASARTNLNAVLGIGGATRP
jgi:Tfp pilus assembly protein PilF